MANLTKLQQAVLAAADNEALTLTPSDRAKHMYIVNVWKNAAFYADEAGYTLEQFRQAIASHYGFSLTWGYKELENSAKEENYND